MFLVFGKLFYLFCENFPGVNVLKYDGVRIYKRGARTMALW